MLFKTIKQIPTFRAGDDTILREVFHPDNDKVDIPYSLAQAAIEVGKSSLPHALKSGELYVFQQGQGKIWINDKGQEVAAGDLVYVPPGAQQHVENTGVEQLLFYCIVAPAWREEEEDVFKSK